VVGYVWPLYVTLYIVSIVSVDRSPADDVSIVRLLTDVK